MLRSNTVPFCEQITLIAVTETMASTGYVTKTETTSTVFASITEGVVRSEFYEAYKAGMRLSLTAEIYADEYSNQPYFTYKEKRYKIIRTFPTGYGTLEMTAEEVER